MYSQRFCPKPGLRAGHKGDGLGKPFGTIPAAGIACKSNSNKKKENILNGHSPFGIHLCCKRFVYAATNACGMKRLVEPTYYSVCYIIKYGSFSIVKLCAALEVVITQHTPHQLRIPVLVELRTDIAMALDVPFVESDATEFIIFEPRMRSKPVIGNGDHFIFRTVEEYNPMAWLPS